MWAHVRTRGFRFVGPRVFLLSSRNDGHCTRQEYGAAQLNPVDLGALGVHAVMLSVNVAIAQLDPVTQQNAALVKAAAASASLKAQTLKLEGVLPRSTPLRSVSDRSRLYSAVNAAPKILRAGMPLHT